MMVPVVVQQLPRQMKLGEVQAFLRDVDPILKTDRPRIVFDFSQVAQMDSAGVDMLLYCMEQAMKGNGDLKLAAVPPISAIILELTQVDRFFEVFDTVTNAVNSFSGFPVHGRQDPNQKYSGSAGPSLSDLKVVSNNDVCGI
jgi:anti-sigma B factor antagonist